jgi:hypothetical protein
MVHLALPVLLEFKVHRVILDLPVQRVFRVSKAFKVQVVRLVLLVQPVFLVLRV